MIPEIDIWRTAWLMVKQHGADAGLHAAKEADRLLDAGDVEGVATWHRIISAIEQLENTKPPERPDKLH